MFSRIDFNQEEYRPAIHRPVILKMINEFQATDLNLVFTDALTAISGMGAVFLLRLLSVGWFTWLVATGVGYFGSDAVTDRSRHRKIFLEQLAELVKTYQWCCETGGEKITSDETFLDILETIAPFIPEGKKLIPKGVVFSPDFKNILSQDPHNVHFIEERKVELSASSLIGSLATSIGSNMSSRFFKEAPPSPPVSRPLQPRVFPYVRLKFYGEPQPDDNKKKEAILNHLPVAAMVETVNGYLKNFK